MVYLQMLIPNIFKYMKFGCIIYVVFIISNYYLIYAAMFFHRWSQRIRAGAAAL